jgi:LAO/AO transport system kinase
VNRRPELDLDALIAGVTAGDRAVLGRAITLIESSHPEHQRRAQDLVTALLPRTGSALRIGLSGVPGAGKSTFIETLGCHLTGEGQRVAVLAVDPSSGVSGGSILGDKTRMQRLATDPNAFIRPSPSSGALGGVARKTRESLLMCEAAGYDVVIVETVGVGQSETDVAGMVDVFFALLLAGAGDELQGIKRGLLELVDLIAVNKADGDGVDPAQRAVAQIRNALQILRGGDEVRVLACSAATGTGVVEVYESLKRIRDERRESGELAERRRDQDVAWMWTLVREQVDLRLKSTRQLAGIVEHWEAEVREGRRSVMDAAGAIFAALVEGDRPGV